MNRKNCSFSNQMKSHKDHIHTVYIKFFVTSKYDTWLKNKCVYIKIKLYY